MAWGYLAETIASSLASKMAISLRAKEEEEGVVVLVTIQRPVRR